MKIPKHPNTIIYIISLLLPVVLTAIPVLIGIIVYIFGDSKGKDLERDTMMTAISAAFWFCLLLLLPMAVYMVLYWIQIYQMWNVINDGDSRATPGKAIGFLFIPFYNLYWIFNIWGGFPTDYNAFVSRYRLGDKVPLLNPTIYQFFPVLILSTGLIITIPVLLIYFAFVLNSSNKAIDNLRNAITGAPQQFSQQPAPNMAFQPQS